MDAHLAELDQRFGVTGLHIQQNDDTMKPLRGFVRSAYAPLIYHSAVQAATAAKIDGIAPAARGLIAGSLFTDTLTEQESLKDILNGRRLSPIMFPQSVPGAIVGVVAKKLTIHGPLSCVSVASQGLTIMLQQAADWIDEGDAEVVLLTFCDIPSLRTTRWMTEYAPIDWPSETAFEPCAVTLVMEGRAQAVQRGAPSCRPISDLCVSLAALPQPMAWSTNWLRSENALTRLLARRSETVALRCHQHCITYRALHQQVQAKMAQLAAEAVTAQRVAINLPDSFTLLEWTLACWQMNNCVLILDPKLTLKEKNQRMEVFGPHALIGVVTEEPDPVAAAQFQPETPSPLTVLLTGERNSRQNGLKSAALALFSSGSTGQPKLIVREFASLNTEWHQYQCEPGAPDQQSKVLCLAPISHAYGLLTATLHTLVRGGTVVFPQMMHARLIVDTLIQEKITHLYGVPFHYQLIYTRLLKVRDQLQPTPVMLSSGGKLDAGLQQRYQQRLDICIGEQYGMSEVGYIAVDLHGNIPGSCGVIARHIQWQLEGNQELLIRLPRSPYVEVQPNWTALQGHGDQQQTLAGLLNTEDLVDIDDHRHLRLCGRSNDQVSIGGLKVRLSEVETALNTHPAITESCVIAHADERFEAWLEAFIVMSAHPVSPAELSQWLTTRLARYKHPRKFTRVDDIPTSDSGKIVRAKLLEPAQ